MEKQLLIIEDDSELSEGLSFALSLEGYAVDAVSRKAEGLARIRAHRYDAVILDCNLPDGNGFDLCAEVRRTSDIPILMLTARDSEIDEVKALKLGMDDYMSKPFSLAVLKARIGKLTAGRACARILRSGEITLDPDARKVRRGEEEVAVSPVEYRLLLYFLENPGRILSKEQILSFVWDSGGRFVDDNTVSVNIRRLRAKLERDPSHPEHIRTVHGMGYLWREE